MNQGKTVLGTQPAQKLCWPGGIAMLFEPDLLPMPLILATDLDRLAQGVIEILNQFPNPTFLQWGLLLQHSDQLSVGE